MRGIDFVLLLLAFFPRDGGYFNWVLGGVRDSCSAGESKTYVFDLEAYNSFGGGCKALVVSKKVIFYYCTYSKYISAIICDFTYCSCLWI